MAKINSIDIAKFKNENYLSFSREFATITGTYPIIAERFGYLVTAYLAAYEELDDCMKQPTWSDLTEPLRKKDEERDKVLLSLKALIEAMRHYSPIEGVTADAERVYRFVKLNTLNPAAQYDKETAQISNFLQDMNKYCQAEVERMGIKPLLATLKTLNDEFAQMIADRDISDSLKKTEAVKQARRILDGLYIALKDTVNGAALVDIEGLLTPYIDAVNQMLKRQETQVLKVKNPSTNKPEGGDNPDITEPEPEPTPEPNPEPDPTPDPDPNDPNNPSSPSNPSNPSNPNNPTPTPDPDPDPDDDNGEGDGDDDAGFGR